MTESQRKAAKAFDAFAAKYNHESGEWLDMGADATFIAGYLAALAEPAPEPSAKDMTAHRAAYFMERFKREEKLLGPNEQAAVEFVINMLAAPVREPAPVPLLTHEEVWAIWNGEIGVDEMNQKDAFRFAGLIEALVRQKAGL